MTDLINLSSLLDDAKRSELVRQHRWPGGVRCPWCNGGEVVRNGRDDTQPYRQRYLCRGCRDRFDDLTGTVLAGHHQPLRGWGLGLSFRGLNLSNRQIAQELNLDENDGHAMTEQLRSGLVVKAPDVPLEGDVEIDEVYVVAGHTGNPAAIEKKAGRGAATDPKGRLAGGRWRRRPPPILGLIHRGGQVILSLLPDVRQATIRPIIEAVVIRGTKVHTDEYDIDARLPVWGYPHKTVCHERGEYARDEDGAGFREVHVNTMEGFWSLLRSWLRPHRGISQEKLPIDLGFFQVVHNARKRGKALLGALVGAPVA